MNRSPLVSVLIPTHDRVDLLRHAVESVLAQTYDRWELIVIDDGSTDGTPGYLSSLDRSRVQVIRQERCGNAAMLRNIGARAARGDYLAFLDSDDLWRPEKLALQVGDMLEHPECGWGYSALVHIDEYGQERPAHRAWTPYRGWILEYLLDVRASAQTSTVMVDRKVFERVGGFDETLVRCQDYDLWLKLAEESQASVVETPVVGFRQHAGNRRVGWLDVLGYMNRIYNRQLSRLTSPRLRAICRRQLLGITLDIASKSRAAGRYAEARQALWEIFPRAWWSPLWWASALKTALRSAIPSGLLGWYYRFRGGRGLK